MEGNEPVMRRAKLAYLRNKRAERTHERETREDTEEPPVEIYCDSCREKR